MADIQPGGILNVSNHLWNKNIHKNYNNIVALVTVHPRTLSAMSVAWKWVAFGVESVSDSSFTVNTWRDSAFIRAV